MKEMQYCKLCFNNNFQYILMSQYNQNSLSNPGYYQPQSQNQSSLNANAQLNTPSYNSYQQPQTRTTYQTSGNSGIYQGQPDSSYRATNTNTNTAAGVNANAGLGVNTGAGLGVNAGLNAGTRGTSTGYRQNSRSD